MTTPHSTRPDQPGQPGQPGQPVHPGQQGLGYEQSLGYEPGARPDQAALGPDFARSAWPAFMAAGLAGLVLGILLLAWPSKTLNLVAILIGASLIVAGLLRLIDGFTAHDDSGGKRVASVVIGLLAIVVGLYCVRHYTGLVVTLAIIVGLFWVIHGIADISVGLFGGSVPGRGLKIVAGVFSLFAGLIVLFWPAISLTVLWAVIGIWLIVYGLVMMITAVSLRRAAAAADAGHLASA